MEIIEFNKKYLNKMIDVFIESFNNSSWHDKWTSETVEKHLNQLINTIGFQGLIAINNEELIGMILGVEHYTFNERTFQIKEFCISSSEKGKGTGSILLKNMEEYLKKQGFLNIELQTLNSADVLSFYEKNGYSEDISSVSMTKSL